MCALGCEIITEKIAQTFTYTRPYQQSVFFLQKAIGPLHDRPFCVCPHGFLLIGDKMFLMLLMRFSDWPTNGPFFNQFSAQVVN